MRTDKSWVSRNSSGHIVRRERTEFHEPRTVPQEIVTERGVLQGDELPLLIHVKDAKLAGVGNYRRRDMPHAHRVGAGGNGIVNQKLRRYGTAGSKNFSGIIKPHASPVQFRRQIGCGIMLYRELSGVCLGREDGGMHIEDT